MLHKRFIIYVFIFLSITGLSQNTDQDNGKINLNRLMDSLWIHPSSFINYNDPNWIRLNQHLQNVDILQLNELIHAIFYGRSSFILNKSRADVGFVGVLNKTSNQKRQRKFHKKIRNGFRDFTRKPENKVVLIEGDSWFEYPVFVRDITDFLEKNPDMAIYSLASGGDWISNMISNLEYEFTYYKIRPDVFIISGGGNDFVGDSRLSAFIADKPMKKDSPYLQEFENYVILRMENIPVSICSRDYCTPYDEYRDSVTIYKSNVDTALLAEIVNGRRFLNKNFYRWMATIKLEYKMLFESLRKLDPEWFGSVKVITQGYDYAIPSFKRRFGIGMFLNNGELLKEPLMVRGIIDPYDQKSVISTIVFEINEMLIELGKEYKNIYHVDSRGLTSSYEKLKGKKPGAFWYDELHPRPKVFKDISKAYTHVIRGDIPTDQKVIVVKNLLPESGCN